MKILLLNTSDNNGGAAIASKRILTSLQNAGITCNLLVQSKSDDNALIVTTTKSKLDKLFNLFRFAFERVIFSLYEKSKEVRFMFSLANTGEDISNHILIKSADILHLNWINFGFLSLRSLEKLAALNKPIVWTCHDMWPFTGGCHHSYECLNYESNCGNCHYLRKPGKFDLSYKILQKKKEVFSKLDLHIVTVSNWLKGRAATSSLFKDRPVTVIHNSLDTNIFKPSNKITARDYLNLPHDKILLLFSAMKLDNPLKGWNYLVKALEVIHQKRPELKNILELVLFGNIKQDFSMLNSTPYKANYIGPISQPEIFSLIYSSADLTVMPSLYETFSQTTAESMACGTPVVAWDNSGPTDIIDHLQNGYLAKFKSQQDLASGIEYILFNADKEKLAEKARYKILNNFSLEMIGKKYIDLYFSILNSRK